MATIRSVAGSRKAQVLAAFLAVYLIWGSTYLAIRFAVETLPPFLLAGTRFLAAGAVLYVWVRLRGGKRPTAIHWRSALIVGGLLLLGGNGVVVWAEQVVPSSLAALLISTVPIWMALMGWLRPGGARPRWQVLFGLAFGFAGVALLVTSGARQPGEQVPLIGIVAVLLASISWASGSLYSHAAKLPASPLLGTGMEQVAGGTLLIVLGLVTGEGGRLNLHTASPRSLLALGYLIVFGSLIAFSAYIWLLRVSTPARVSTYAYVNPVVAVFLGWAFSSEPITSFTLVAAAIIVAAVVVITTFQTSSATRTEEPQTSPAEGEPIADDVAPAASRR
jgi:drug/metabolite transporter (DMT)-like permease